MSINEINIPINNKYPSPSTDALQDFYININSILNYTSEMLLLLELNKSPTIEPKRIEINLGRTILGEPIISPNLNIAKSFTKISKNTVEELFNSSLTRIASCYEGYLNQLMHELYWHNDIIQSSEIKVPISEVFRFNSLESLEDDLIQNIILSTIMQSYPKLVKTFQDRFFIGIHSRNAPITLEEVHNFIELRNLVVHNHGHANKHYLDRVKKYQDLNFPELLKRQHSSISVNFHWLFTISDQLLKLGDFIDKQAQERWNTSIDA